MFREHKNLFFGLFRENLCVIFENIILCDIRNTQNQNGSKPKVTEVLKILNIKVCVLSLYILFGLKFLSQKMDTV